MDSASAAQSLEVTPGELEAIERGDQRALASFIYRATKTYGISLAELYRPPQPDNDR